MAALPAAGRAAPVQYATNHHYYEVVFQSQGITWDAANTAANARTFNGLQGHLATMTSPNENAFIASHFSQAVRQAFWLGGFQRHGILDPGAGWQWVTGEPWSFTNWNVVNADEPDDKWGPGSSDQDETRLQFADGAADGTWKDARAFDPNARGYVVEYEPSPSADLPTITGYTTAASRGVALVGAPPGAAVLITGTSLGTSGTVLFDGIPFTAATLKWSPTEILAVVPTAPSYPFPTRVTVVVDRQQASGGPLTIAAPLPGQDNLLANGSFEYPGSSGSPTSSGYTYGLPIVTTLPYFQGYSIPGWRIPFGTIDVVRSAWSPAPGQGQQSIDLVGSPNAAIIAQSFFTELGREYIFSGWVAHNYGIPEARADVFLNREFLGQLHHQGPATATQMGWTPFAYRFRATTEQTTLAIEDVTGLNYAQGTALDGLTVTPAPGS
jgi:Protein of unknown function (DUF642)